MNADRDSSSRARWAGHGLTFVACLMMFQSVVVKIVQPDGVPAHFENLGWPLELLTGLAVVEFTCTVLSLIPRTALLGVVALTAYLGGATAAHVRIGDAVAAYPIVLGVIMWAGLWLREPRLRQLFPLKLASGRVARPRDVT